jgi:hypothetical protein
MISLSIKVLQEHLLPNIHLDYITSMPKTT